MHDGSPPDETVAGGPDDGPTPDADTDDEAPPDAHPDEIPSVVLAAIKDRMHARRFSAPDDPSHVRASLGTADDDLHVVDDGPDHCMIGRPVGYAPDGCVYVLVARLSRYGYEQLRDGDNELPEAFSDAREISLCAVYEVEGTVQNIALVRRFNHGADIPREYLPPSPFLEFVDDESADDGEPTEAESADEDEAPEGTDAGGSHRGEPDGGDEPAEGDLLIDEEAVTDEPAGAGLMRRVFGRATATFRRLEPPGGRSGFPGI